MASVINIEVDDTGIQYVYVPLNIPSIGTHTFTLNVTLTQENYDKNRKRKDFAKKHAAHNFDGGRRRTRRKRRKKRRRRLKGGATDDEIEWVFNRINTRNRPEGFSMLDLWRALERYSPPHAGGANIAIGARYPMMGSIIGLGGWGEEGGGLSKSARLKTRRF